MRRRRVVALLVAATTALLIPSIARADTKPASPSPEVQLQFQPALIIRPTSGPAGQPFAATYSAGGGNCSGGGFQVVLSWDGGPFASPKTAGSRCTAGWRSVAPPAGAGQGTHDVAAVLLNCSQGCAPVDGTQADAPYTIADDATPPPTDPPATAPPAAPAAIATPRPTLTPTPLGLAPAGTFPSYGCRNGIPDSTPCPVPTGAVAALIAGPGTEPPPAAASSTSDTSANVPWRTVALGVALAIALILAALALGWRQGAGRRNRKAMATATPAGVPDPDANERRSKGLGFGLASMARRGRKAPSAVTRRAPPPEPRPGGHRAPPPPSAPRPPDPPA